MVPGQVDADRGEEGGEGADGSKKPRCERRVKPYVLQAVGCCDLDFGQREGQYLSAPWL